MKLYTKIFVFLLFSSFTLIDARGPDPKFYTGYRCSATTECPKDAGFCNEEQQCECSIGRHPMKIGDKTVCEDTVCGADYECQNHYGNNSGCNLVVTRSAKITHYCRCIGRMEYSLTDRECSSDKLKIGEECSSDKNCTGDGSYSLKSGTFCNSATGKCSCQLGQVPHGDWFCKTIDCNSLDGPRCGDSDPKLDCVWSYDMNSGICRCEKGYEPDRQWHPFSCIKPTTGTPCKNWEDCPRSLECRNGSCQKETPSNSSHFLSSSVFVVFTLLTFLIFAQ